MTRALGLVVLCAALLACSSPKFEIRHPATHRLEPAVRDAIASARFEFDAAIAQDPRAADAYRTLGRWYLAHHLNDAAGDCFDAARELEPSSVDAHYLAGVARVESGAVDAARSAFERVLAVAPDDAYAAYRLGVLHQVAGRIEDAAPLIARALAALPRDAAVQAAAGELALTQNRFNDAQQRFESALSLQPQATRLVYPLARARRGAGASSVDALLAGAGNGEVRLQDPRLREVATLSRSTQMLLERGQALVTQRRYREAVAIFEQATNQRPDDVFGWVSLGRARELLGDETSALTAFERAVEIDDASATAQRFLGMFHERRGNDAAARVAYQQAVRFDADDAPARLLFAHALQRADEFEAAASEYATVARARPANVTARYYLAVARLMTGDCTGAGEALREGLSIKGNYGPLLEAQIRHAAVCDVGAEVLADAGALAKQLEAARPDAASAVTRALVAAALGDAPRASQARRDALARAGSQIVHARIASHLPDDGSLPMRAFAPGSPALEPPRLRRD